MELLFRLPVAVFERRESKTLGGGVFWESPSCRHFNIEQSLSVTQTITALAEQQPNADHSLSFQFS